MTHFGQLTYSELKLLAQGFISPEGSDRPIPYLMVWPMRPDDEMAHYESEYIEPENLHKPENPSKRNGWCVVQVAVFTKQWETKIASFGTIITQRRKDKTYPTLDAIVEELKEAFDGRAVIQLRGL